MRQKRSQPTQPALQRKMTLISNDNAEYDVEEYIIRESETFKNAHAKGIFRLVLQKINGPTLLNIIEYLTLYRNSKPYKPVEIKSMPIRASKNDIGQKYLKKLSDAKIDDLLQSTHHVQSSRLTDGVCAYLLHRVQHKNPDQIRDMFCLPDTSNGEGPARSAKK